MRNKREKSPRSLLHVVMDVIIGFLCVCLVGAVVFTANMIYEDSYYGWQYSEDSFYYRMEDEAYGWMVEMYHANEAAGVEPTENMREYYGVARYFEAASYYKMYEGNQDTEKMLYYEEQMKDALEDMGELQFLEANIMEKLDRSR